jgi:DUF4097 and DUF4098 domain-containing protein YvlB
MTEESLQKLFTNLKNAPAETNVAEVSQWIGAASTVAVGTSIIQKLIQKKLIIMSSIITSTIIVTIIFFSTGSTKKQQNKVAPIIKKNVDSTISKVPKPIFQKKKTEKLLSKNKENVSPITQLAIIDTPAANNLIVEQKEAPQIVLEAPKIINNDTSEVPRRNEDYTSSGSWKSLNDSLHVDTVFNGVKALVFKSSHINDKIVVHGSKRSNVAMNFNYKYKVKGIYTRKNRECEVSYEKKDSVLTIQINRKNSVNIGITYYSKETSNLSFEVPENIAVQIKTSYGDIDANGLKNNEFNFQTSHGDIKATVLSGNINLTSGYGDIDLNELNGKIDINTGYGDINGKKITISKQISIKSGYGDIDCQIMNPISDCKVDLKTGYGKVKIKRTDLELEAGSKLIFGKGDIQFTAKSGYGDVTIR